VSPSRSASLQLASLQLTAHQNKPFREITITHPAHPLHGHRVCVRKVIRKNNEVFFGILLSDGTPALIPRSWTDEKEEESSVYKEVGALFRIPDLLRLRQLVDSLEPE
jgi:hypothetical protein